jgi:plasmid maintenance system antidote protein VapI
LNGEHERLPAQHVLSRVLEHTPTLTFEEAVGVLEKSLGISIAFNTSAEIWQSQQVQYDLWHVEQGRKALKVIKLAA